MTTDGFTVAIGFNSFGDIDNPKNSIAIGTRCGAGLSTDVRGMTLIGTDLTYKPDAVSELTRNTIAISQFNGNFSDQLPHFYATDKIVCPNGDTTTDILDIDYTLYTAVFMEYSIYNNDGDEYRAGTYTAAFKLTGSVVDDDKQTVVFSGTTLSATFLTSISGNIVTIQIRNQDSDTYNFRFSARLLMR
jgi:hypothetical protein